MRIFLNNQKIVFKGLAQKKIAVIILNWNGRSHLATFLPSVVAYSAEADIILADNASTDDSLAYVRAEYPEVIIMENACNEGFAQGYNTFIERCSDYTYSVLLNNDVAVTEGWLRRPLEIMEQQSDIAAVQPKICSYERQDFFEYAGAAGGMLDRLGYPYCRGRILDTVEQDRGQYEEECEIFWASGAAYFVRTELYLRLGGLDADFFAHMEEIDLSWRIWNAGYRICYTSKSVVYHLGGGSMAYGSPRKTYLNFRNNLSMLVKNLPARGFWRTLLLRFILDGVAGLKFLLSGEWRHMLAIVRAHYYIYTNIAELKEKRHNTQRTESGLDHVVYPYSILWKYYFEKKKTFKDLKG